MIMKFLSLDKCGIGVVQWLLILLVTLVQLCSGANILVIEGMASPSHHVWMKTLSYALAEQGHNVTSLSSYMETNNVPANLHYLFMEKVQPALYSDTAEIDYIQMNQMSVYEFIMVYYEYFGLTWVMGKTSKGFQHLLDYPSDFKVDLIIIDSLSPDGFYVFAEKFGNPPLITAGGYPFPTDSAKFTGAPFYFSLIPSPMIMTMGYGFIERLRNFIIYTGVEFYEKYFELPATQKEVRNIIPSIRPLRELKRSAKINFVNYNTVPMVDFVQPILPNVIPVGGLQITDPKPLPSDLQSIYDDQRVKGVVVFSLGTNIRPEALGKAVLSRVLKYLGEISEYNFIWKLKASQMDLEVPKNVFVRDWLPQNDLLAQNRTVLFISHAGGLSTQETHWYGVPMLCVPGFFDQFPNCAQCVRAGIARKVDLLSISEDIFKETLLEMLNNPIYLERAQLKSKLFQDQPEKPLNRALWWVDYVLRNPDISHLKSKQLSDLNYIEKHSIDIISFVAIVIFIIFVGIIKFSLLCVKKKTRKDDKMKRQ